VSKRKTKIQLEEQNLKTLKGDVRRNQKENPDHFKLVSRETASSLPLDDNEGGNIEMLNANECKAFNPQWKTSEDKECVKFRLSRNSFELYALSKKTLTRLKAQAVDLDLMKS
jgi:hypothetical protein